MCHILFRMAVVSFISVILLFILITIMEVITEEEAIGDAMLIAVRVISFIIFALMVISISISFYLFLMNWVNDAIVNYSD